MKSMLKFVAVFSFVVLVAGCGKDTGGGVKNSGAGPDGKCTAAMTADMNEFIGEFQKAGMANDRPKAKNLCDGITAKYGNTTCTTANGGTFDGSKLVEECGKL